MKPIQLTTNHETYTVMLMNYYSFDSVVKRYKAFIPFLKSELANFLQETFYSDGSPSQH